MTEQVPQNQQQNNIGNQADDDARNSSEYQRESSASQQQPASPFSIPGMEGRHAMMLPRLSVLNLLMALFLYPRLALITVRIRKSWGKPLIIVLFATAIAFAIKTRLEYPSVRQKCDQLGTLLIENLQELSYMPDGDKFRWSAPLSLPYKAFHEGWRLDVVDQFNDFDKTSLTPFTTDLGIVIAHDKIAVWSRKMGPAIDAPLLVDNLPRKYINEMFRTFGKPAENAYTLDQQSFTDLVSSLLVPSMAIMSGIQYVFVYFNLLFTCVFLFVVISLLFRWRDRTPFAAIFASSLACSLPPYLLMMLFSLMPFVTVTPDFLFTIFFVIYLIVIFLDKSVTIKAGADHGNGTR